jgi:hypothetical protein
MRCKQCDYPLWNLRSRQCPECGRPFQPSEFEFVSNSVRFCCPHCNQDYYGTGTKGHLVPSEFTCVRCHHNIRMDDMVLLPTEGVQEEQTVTDVMPWLDSRPGQGARGRPLSSYFVTTFRVLFEPGRLARAMPAEPALGRAIVYAAICSFLPPLVGASGMLLFAAFVPGGVMVLAGMMGLLLGATAMAGVLLALWIASAHAVLRLTGPTQGSIARTAEPLCYGTAGNLLSGIPCIGIYFGWIGWIWGGVAASIMLAQRQRVGGGRAALAVFTFPVLLFLGLIVLIVALFIPAMQQAQVAARQAMQQVQAGASITGQATQVGGGLLAHQARLGDWPGHALQLVQANDVAAQALVGPDSGRGLDDVPVGPMTLQDFVFLPPQRERNVAEAAARGLPAGVVAHRLGDYVFTYHGVGVDQDPTLWIAIYAPPRGTARLLPAATDEYGQPIPPSEDPRQMAATPMVAIIQLDGNVVLVPETVLPTLLRQQNQLRRSLNLPPLPDPRDVNDAEPAVGRGR